MSKPNADLTVDEQWGTISDASQTSIQERQDQHTANNLITPRSIIRHDSKASYQDITSPTSFWSPSLSHAAHQRNTYKPKTAIRDRPTQHSRTHSKGSYSSSGDNCVHQLYVKPYPYDKTSTSAVSSYQQHDTMESLPPRPAPFPRDFEGFKSEERISSSDRFVRSNHCERCGRELMRRSFSSM